MWHRVKDVRYVLIQQNDHSIRFLFLYDVNLFSEKFQSRLNWSILSTFHERVEQQLMRFRYSRNIFAHDELQNFFDDVQ
jgi:hypothetical protein